MRTTNSLTALLLAGALLGGCGDRPSAWNERERDVIGPIPMGDRVAYVDTGRDRVVVIDASTAQPRTYTFHVGRRPLYATPTPDSTRLAVVTRGQEAYYEGERDEQPGLYMVNIEEPGAVAIRYELESPFDRLAIAKDGTVAVAYFSSGGVDSDGLFRNPNELAVIDLAAEPSAQNPFFRTVRSFSSAPTGVVLSPPMGIPGDPEPLLRTLAFVLAPNTVTILDATHPDRKEVTIRLSQTSTLVTPEEIVFAPNAGAAYLRAGGARDILSILLTYEAPVADTTDDNDYQPALTELGAGGTPADIAVYDDYTGVRRAIAATPGTHEVTVIDTDTAEFITIPTVDPIDRIILLPENEPHVAVLASIATRAPRVHLLDLGSIAEENAFIDVRTVDLAEPLHDVVPVPCRELALIVHDDARTILGILDVAMATVAPLEGAGRLDTYDFASCGDGAFNHLVGATHGVPRVGVVDLDIGSLHPSDFRLDDLPRTVFALESGGVFIDHGDTALGRATVLPHPNARRDEAVMFSGFLAAGMLDERL